MASLKLFGDREASSGKKSKLTKRWRRDSYLACKANGPAPLGTNVIRVCYTRFSSREPDSDGLAGSFKAIQDGVVDWVSETNEGFDDRAHQLRPAWLKDIEDNNLMHNCPEMFSF